VQVVTEAVEEAFYKRERYKFDRLGAWFILGVFPGMTHGEDGYDSTAGVRARGVLAGCDTAAGK
jgi:hypothetical protein